MLKKAIIHVIQAKKSKINARKRFRKLGVWIVAKKLHPHP